MSKVKISNATYVWTLFMVWIARFSQQACTLMKNNEMNKEIIVVEQVFPVYTA